MVGVEDTRLVKQFKIVVCRDQRTTATDGIALQGNQAHPVPVTGVHRVFQKHGQPIQFPGTAEEIDLGMLPHQLLPGTFRQASDQPQDDALPITLAYADTTDAAEDLVLCLRTDGAGVVENDVRIAVTVNEVVAEKAQLPLHELAVQFVHLAAEGLKVDRPRAGVHGGR